MYSSEAGRYLVDRAERSGCVYDLRRPAGEISRGTLLELEDFHNSARSIGSAASLGTRVFKEAVGAVNNNFPVNADSPYDPFSHIWSLDGSLEGFTIWGTNPCVTLKLRDFYIKTQPFKDLYDSMPLKARLEVFAACLSN